MNEKYSNQINKLEDRIEQLEKQLKAEVTYNVYNKIYEMEAKFEKIDEVSNEMGDNTTRLAGLESELHDQKKFVDGLAEDLKNLEEKDSSEKLMQDSLSKFQAENIDALTKRIDTNETHIKLLEEKDEELESNMECFTENLNVINGR